MRTRARFDMFCIDAGHVKPMTSDAGADIHVVIIALRVGGPSKVVVRRSNPERGTAGQERLIMACLKTRVVMLCCFVKHTHDICSKRSENIRTLTSLIFFVK